DRDLRVPRDVPDVEPRHAGHREVALYHLGILLAAEVGEVAHVEVEVHRVADGPAQALTEAGAHARAHRATDLVAKTTALVSRTLALITVRLALLVPGLVIPLAGLLELLARAAEVLLVLAELLLVLVAHHSASNSVAASSRPILPRA